MKRRKRDTGITITCNQEEKQQAAILYYLGDMFLDSIFYMLLIYGCVIGVFVACGAPVHIRISLEASLVLLIPMQFVLDRRFSNKVVIAIYLFFMILLLLLFAKNILEGAIYFASYYVEFINSYFHVQLETDTTSLELEASYALMCFQVFWSWFLLFLCVLFRKTYKKPLIALFFSVVSFSLYFVVGLIPEAKYLFSFLVGFLPLYILGRGDDAVLGIQAKVTTLLGVAGLAILCIAILPEGLYQEHLPAIYETKRDIQNLSEGDFISNIKYYFSDFLDDDTGGVFGIKGGLDDGEIGDRDELIFDKKTDFVLTTTSGAKDSYGNDYELYLRSYIGSNYTNKSWGDLKEDQKEAYRKLTEKYNFDFENQIAALEEMYTKMSFGDGDEPEGGTETITIEKKDIGKKSTLLPYGVIEPAYSENGYISTDKTYKKREYSVDMYADALMEDFESFEDPTIRALPVIRTARACMDEYKNVESDGFYLTDPFVNDAWGFHRIQGGSRELFKPFYERELEYRKYVYDNYTRVPDGVAPELREKLNRCFNYEEYGLVEDFGGLWFDRYQPNFDVDFSNSHNFEDNFSDPLDLYYYMWWCKDSINAKTHYSLEPGKVPEGEDLVDYFLFTNHKGYCSYYATAATIFLRMCGVPARYVEGYKVTSKDLQKHGKKIEKNGEPGYTLNVTDEYAHAWIEVYIDQCGWIPYDITPARGDFIPGLDKQDSDSKNQDTTSVSAKPSPVPSVKPSASVSPSPSKALVSSKPPKSGSKVKGKKSKIPSGYHELTEGGKLALLIICLIVILLVAIMVRYSFILKSKSKQRGYGNNSRARFYYREIDRIIRIKVKNIKPSDEIQNCIDLCVEQFEILTNEEMYDVINIVEKATFGASEISDYECTKVGVLYESLRNYLYNNSSFIERLYYKIWKAF